MSSASRSGARGSSRACRLPLRRCSPAAVSAVRRDRPRPGVIDVDQRVVVLPDRRERVKKKTSAAARRGVDDQLAGSAALCRSRSNTGSRRSVTASAASQVPSPLPPTHRRPGRRRIPERVRPAVGQPRSPLVSAATSASVVSKKTRLPSAERLRPRHRRGASGSGATLTKPLPKKGPTPWSRHRSGCRNTTTGARRRRGTIELGVAFAGVVGQLAWERKSRVCPSGLTREAVLGFWSGRPRTASPSSWRRRSRQFAAVVVLKASDEADCAFVVEVEVALTPTPRCCSNSPPPRPFTPAVGRTSHPVGDPVGSEVDVRAVGGGAEHALHVRAVARGVGGEVGKRARCRVEAVEVVAGVGGRASPFTAQ